MDLQSLFYLLGIIFMTISITILIVAGIIVFYVKNKIEQTARKVDEKIDSLTRMTAQPGQIAATVGTVVVDSAVKKMRSFLNKKKKTS